MLSAKGVDVMEMFLRHEGWRTSGGMREEGGANGDEEEVRGTFMGNIIFLNVYSRMIGVKRSYSLISLTR